MKSFCKEHANGFLINLEDKSYYLTAWQNIAISWGDVCASIENGTCGTFQGLVRYDVFSTVKAGTTYNVILMKYWSKNLEVPTGSRSIKKSLVKLLFNNSIFFQ